MGDWPTKRPRAEVPKVHLPARLLRRPGFADESL